MWALPGSRRGYVDASSWADACGGAAAVLRQPLVAVAINKNKGSQGALKWALDNLVSRGQTIVLVHILAPKHASPTPSPSSSPEEPQDEDPRAREVFLPFRCFCARKEVRCEDVWLEDDDVARGIIEFISQYAVEKMIVGLPSRSTFVRRLKTMDRDIPTAVREGAPDFCTVYVVGKGKVSSMRQAARPAPMMCPPQPQDRRLERTGHFKSLAMPKTPPKGPPPSGLSMKASGAPPSPEGRNLLQSPGRTSIDERFLHSKLYDSHLDIDYPPSRSSTSSDAYDMIPPPPRRKTRDPSLSGHEFSFSPESHRSSSSSHATGSTSSPWSSHAAGSPRQSTSSRSSLPEELEEEMRRLRQELKQTMDMYSTACKEALSARQMARELRRWQKEETQRLESARASGVAALALAEKEKARSKAAAEAAEAARRTAEMEVRRRKAAEMAACKDAVERNKALAALMKSDTRYRRYSIEEIEVATDFFAEKRKIGEGGYGPVFRGILDHTPVAIKILRPDAAHGRSQFLQEVQLLSCIRHPNMVLLLGACPEYGCLVYEYMENGSLEDRLFRRKGTPPLSWQLRFKIAAQIGTGLLFLHQARPEPVVHRDLKPGNILLDGNFVSKIADVGLARLVPSGGDLVTQCRVTSTAGTLCYIDPEYQQTGLLGTMSDIYSLGVILLQLLTGQAPMGLAHKVERAIKDETFELVLDPAVRDWPVQEALSLAKTAIRCAELKRKDRPDLSSEILPELNRLREFAGDILRCEGQPEDDGRTSVSNDIMSDHPLRSSGGSSSKSRCSVSFDE